MNSVLLSAGVALVLALFAALLAPFFIDWNTYKHVLEAQLSEAVGRPVVIGTVEELHLLPTPVMKASGFRIESGDGADDTPLVAAPRIEARIALTPILSGDLRVEELVIERPVLQLRLRGDGGVALSGFGATRRAIDPERVSLNALEIRDATIIIRDEHLEEVKTLSGFNLVGEAGSLSGPFKAEGGVVADGALYTFRLATGRLQTDGALRTKFSLQPASGAFELALDGLLSAMQGQPEFAGAARLQQVAVARREDIAPGEEVETAWRANLEIVADPLAVDVTTFTLGIGPEERAVQFAGSGRIDLYPALRLSADMETRQIDLDRALGHGPGGRARVAELGPVASGLMQRFESVALPMALRLRADAALINGGLAEGLDIDADLAGGILTVNDLMLRLPGKTVLSGSGTVVLGATPSFDGSTQLETRQAGPLLQWLGLEELRVGTLRIRPGMAALVAKTQMRLREGELRLDGLTAQLDDSNIAGRILYQGGEQRKVDLSLAIDVLDLDRYVEMEPEGAEATDGQESELDRPPPEIGLRLNADALTVGGVEAKTLLADLVYSAGSLTLNSLSLGDVGGTQLAAAGRIDDLFGNADGEIIASLTSEDLTGAARLGAGFGLLGGNLVELEKQAAAMSPAAVELTLKAARSPSGTQAEAQWSGALGGTVAKARAAFRGRLAELTSGTLDLVAEASNPHGDLLLAQLGLPGEAESGPAMQPGKVRLTLAGRLADGANLNAEAGLLGATGSIEGTLTAASQAAFSGKVAVDSGDVRPLLRRFGAPGKDNQLPLPAGLSARVDRQGTRWRLSAIDGRAGSETFTGELELNLPPDAGSPRRVGGRLDFDSLELAWVLAALLGEESGGASAQTWPEGPFDLSATRLIEGGLTVSINRLALPGGATAGGARFDLAMEPGIVAVRDLRARLYGGEVVANLRISDSRRDRGAELNAEFSLKDAVVEQFAWAPRRTPVATGTLDVNAQISGHGRSWLGLISSLEGEGSFHARDGVLRGLDPDAFVEIVKAADAGIELAEDRVLDLFQGYLAAGALPYDNFEGVFTLNDGVISAKNVALKARDAGVRVSTLVDLHSMELDSEWMLMQGQSAEGEGEVPPVTLIFAGPVDAPRRQLDVNALTGYLTVRRIEEDVRRLEEAQADALERERLDRLQLRQTQDHMRRVRERRERERMQTEQIAREQQEQARREAARREAERLEQERREAARLEAERLEAEQLELERQSDAQAVRRLPASPALQLVPPEQSPRQKTLEQLVEEALRDSLEPPAPPPATPGPVILTRPVTPPVAQRRSNATPQRSTLAEPPPAAEVPSWATEPRSGSIRLPYDPVDPGG